MKNYELICLRYLNYDLDRITPYKFLELFFKNGLAFEGEISFEQLDKLYLYGVKILNSFIKDQRYFDFTPLQIACAIVKLSREAYKMDGWPRCYEVIYKLRGEDYMNCYFVIKTIYINKPTTSNSKPPKPSTDNGIKSTITKKKCLNLNSQFIPSHNGNYNEDSILTHHNHISQTNKHIPRPQSDISCNNIPSLSTFTPNYINNNIKYQNNDYYGNCNLKQFNNYYNKNNQKNHKKPQYMNSSDNNDLNSTIDEIVECQNGPIITYNNSASIQHRKIDRYETNCIFSQNNQTVSPFNLYYFSSYNSNQFNNQIFPVNSMDNFNNKFLTNNYSIKSNTHLKKPNNEKISINKIFLESERQLLPEKSINWFS